MGGEAGRGGRACREAWLVVGLQGLHAGLGAAFLDAAEGGALLGGAAAALVAQRLGVFGREGDAGAFSAGLAGGQEVGELGALHRRLLRPGPAGRGPRLLL